MTPPGHRAAYPEFVDKLVNRWLERDPEWLTLQLPGSEPADRPVATMVHHLALDGEAEARQIPVMAADFLSPLWREPRLPAALAWVGGGSVVTATADVRDAAALHLRRGGIVAVFGWPAPDAAAVPPAIAAVSPDRPAGDHFWIDGAHGRWLAQRRMAVRALQLFGHAAHVDRDAGSDLLPAIRELWHGLFAWHVDVAREVAKGVDRFRYTQPDFKDAAEETVEWCAARLADAGIRARGVLLA